MDIMAITIHCCREGRDTETRRHFVVFGIKLISHVGEMQVQPATLGVIPSNMENAIVIIDAFGSVSCT
jgi:extradiol dioxygenase family protein